MSQSLILLDTGPLGLITNRSKNPECQACQQWFNSLSDRILLPEICDYELRRELIRANKLRGLRQLDQLKTTVLYLPITTTVMLKAAELWAKARNEGYPTAPPEAIDGDVILAAQALLLQEQGQDTIIATTNVGHLSRFTPALTWQAIR
ncbi:MAG: type II toxin-antitoxin system VapC family toxin [Alkalinema sp. RU_4_3]|nr:type II toxin-antitoxin system VapC family toxin [Alkalinema sp. RU_4_3]